MEANTISFTLGILEAGQAHPDFAAEHGDIGDWFVRALPEQSEHALAFKRYPTHGGTVPGSLDECDGYLVTGSAASVLEQTDWMRAAQDFIVEAAAHRPVLGVCFGHQLIADAYGGRVEKSPAGWNAGVKPYRVSTVKPWMDPSLDCFRILSSNADHVAEAPDNAEVLASNETCPVAMMQIGENVLTLQAHPEMETKTAKSIYCRREEQLGAACFDAALKSLDGPIDGGLVSRWLVNFLTR